MEERKKDRIYVRLSAIINEEKIGRMTEKTFPIHEYFYRSKPE